MIRSAAVDGLIVFSMPKDDDSRPEGAASPRQGEDPDNDCVHPGAVVDRCARWAIRGCLRLSTNPELPGGSPIVEFLEFGYLPSKSTVLSIREHDIGYSLRLTMEAMRSHHNGLSAIRK